MPFSVVFLFVLLLQGAVSFLFASAAVAAILLLLTCSLRLETTNDSLSVTVVLVEGDHGFHLDLCVDVKRWFG